MPAIPGWAKPDWQDDDIFALAPPEQESVKRQVAWALGIRFKACQADKPWAEAVPGINAFSLDNVTTYLKEYMNLKGERPVNAAEETEAAFNDRIATWESKLSSKSSLSFVVSGLQLP